MHPTLSVIDLPCMVMALSAHRSRRLYLILHYRATPTADNYFALATTTRTSALVADNRELYTHSCNGQWLDSSRGCQVLSSLMFLFPCLNRVFGVPATTDWAGGVGIVMLGLTNLGG